jgi:DNA-binding NarL/FixJ family response regulator
MADFVGSPGVAIAPPAAPSWTPGGAAVPAGGALAEPTPPEVRVLLVDDHPIVRSGVRYILERHGGFAIVGEAATGREAIRLVMELLPDVVLMDVSLPDVSGLEATRTIKQHAPGVRVLIVSMHSDEEYVLGVLDAGADGYLLKQGPPDELRLGILRVQAGERVLHQLALQALVSRAMRQTTAPTIEALSAREQEILEFLAEGSTSKEIAAVLGLAPKTVENHRARILDKLGVANSAAAVRTALAQGLIRSGSTHFHTALPSA